MKIGSISLNINAPDFNYGAILHSWAFQKYLKKLDFVDQAEIINYTMPKLENQHLKYPFIDKIKVGNIKGCVKSLLTYPFFIAKYNKFKKFILNNMIVTEKKYTQKTLEEASLLYDTVICESDVIWSPGFSGGHFDKSFFMDLDSMAGMLKIAYAPSMADGDLSVEQEQELKELLVSVDYISCRETYEKTILSKYTDKEVTHVLDPVMLLNAEDFDKITDKRITDRQYILLYLPVDNNKNLRKSAKQFANKYNYKIIEISTDMNIFSGTTTFVSAGIEEFLSAIKYAEVIFTNSFHAICFSIIYNKQFYAFSRRCPGKIMDICKVFDINNRYCEFDNFVELPNIDYTKVNRIWDIKKKTSKEWLENILHNNC